ncbi:hypothetical protein HDZ31DRAFT_81783 [Schizophyllum fasciatum]
MISRMDSGGESVAERLSSQPPTLAHRPPDAADCPLHRLPNEILTLIFRFCVASQSGMPNQFFHDTSKAPWVITHICHRWRAAAHRTPSLWTTIRLSVDALEEPMRSRPEVTELLSSYLERSHPLPISITIMSEDGFPAHILGPIVATCERWHDLFIFIHPDDLPRIAVIRGRLPALQALQIIPTRLGQTNAPPTMFEVAPRLDTLTLGGHALELGFALPWSQIRSFEANYIDPAHVLRALPRMPELIDLKLGREPPEHAPGAIEGLMITPTHVRTLTLNVVEGQRSPGHPGDLLEHLTLPALTDLEVECDVEESIESIRRLVERSDCRIEALTLVVTFSCSGNLKGLFGLLPHLRRLTLFDGSSMTDGPLLDALVVRPEDPGSVLLPKMEHITLLASTPLQEHEVQRWLDVFESRVEPQQPQDSDGEDDGARQVHALRSILMGCTSGENIVDNRLCLDRFNVIRVSGVMVDLCGWGIGTSLAAGADNEVSNALTLHATHTESAAR